MNKNKAETEKMEIVWDFVGPTIERVIANAKSAGKIGVYVPVGGVAAMIEPDATNTPPWSEFGLFAGTMHYGIIAAALMRGELSEWNKDN